MCIQKSHNIYCEGQLKTSRQKNQRVKGASKSKEQYGPSKNKKKRQSFKE
jgi:hypothetical protein